ncbi:hypothetical protein Tcan_00550, partial [Toxocara canis]
ANGAVIIAEDPQTLEELLNKLNSYAKAIGHIIHIGKAQRMENAYCTGFDMKLENENIELVDCYAYLGQAAQMDNDLGEVLSRRKKEEWVAFMKLRGVLTNRNTPPSLKAELFNSIILP